MPCDIKVMRENRFCKSRKLLACLGYATQEWSGEYEQVFECVLQKPSLCESLESEPMRKSVTAHLFVMAHKHEESLDYFMHNPQVMQKVVGEIDASKYVEERAAPHAAAKYANYLVLRGALNEWRKGRKNAQIVVMALRRYVRDVKSRGAFMVNKVKKMLQPICDEVATHVMGQAEMEAGLLRDLKSLLKAQKKG